MDQVTTLLTPAVTGYKLKLNLRQSYDTSYDKLMTCLATIDHQEIYGTSVTY